MNGERITTGKPATTPYFIVVEGVDGVGKTTFVKHLAARLGASQYKSPGGVFAQARAVVDTAGLAGLERYHFFRSATQSDSAAIALLLRDGPVVCDRYIDSTIVCNAARDPRVWEVADRRHLCVPVATIVLTARPEVIAARLAARANRDHEELDLAFVLRCDQSFRRLGHPILDSSDATPDLLVEQAMALIQSAACPKPSPVTVCPTQSLSTEWSP